MDVGASGEGELSVKRRRDGAAIGILMLESRFPRLPGDAGNPATWPFPVILKTVRGATPDAVVRDDPTRHAHAFLSAAHALVKEGVDGITTTCGFLCRIQDVLQASLPVPVLTSALSQVAAVNAMLPGGAVAAVLTVSAEDLTPQHLEAARVPAGTPVIGTTGAFRRTFLGDADDVDVEACRADMIEAARQAAAQANVGAIVLECANMPVFADSVHEATGLPVFSIYDAVCWLHASLRPRRWPEQDIQRSAATPPVLRTGPSSARSPLAPNARTSRSSRP